MSNWAITFTRNDSTTRVEMDSPVRPCPDSAARFLLQWAAQHLPEQQAQADEFGADPGSLLYARYGATVSAIIEGAPAE
ncbi:MAG: hypothetical protein GAK45_00607 [Pseudomonas citronellolis]|nr:MAG: hypothetical protein GAK45_00607 [Pseudomonas citronellolis]